MYTPVWNYGRISARNLTAEKSVRSSLNRIRFRTTLSPSSAPKCATKTSGADTLNVIFCEYGIILLEPSFQSSQQCEYVLTRLTRLSRIELYIFLDKTPVPIYMDGTLQGSLGLGA